MNWGGGGDYLLNRVYCTCTGYGSQTAASSDHRRSVGGSHYDFFCVQRLPFKSFTFDSVSFLLDKET